MERQPNAFAQSIATSALVDVGGGLRGIYGAGVLDRCLDDGVAFDACIGVSAGSANTITYLAGQRGRTKRFYLEYAFRPQYMSLGNFLRRRGYLDLDYVYGTLSNHDGEDPLDYGAFARNPGSFEAVATDADTGEAHYFGRRDIAPDRYDVLKASCSLPLACKPIAIAGHRYFDGGLSDPIPFKRALESGCEKAVVVLTRPRSYRRSSRNDNLNARLLRRRHPAMAEALRRRADTYNQQLDEAEQLAAQGRILILAPASTDGIKTLSKDREKLEGLYAMGYEDAASIPAFLNSPLPRPQHP